MMGDLIAWKTAEEIMKILASESAMVAGMSIEEAAAAYGYTLTSSGMYVKTITDVAAAAGSAATAGEAIAGTVATGGATTTAANLTLYTTASGTTAVGSLGSIALPIAACCLAGAAGYKLGNITGDMIEKAYPDFFTGMFESVSEFVTGDKYGLAYIFTGEGEVYMPTASQEAIKEYLENQIANNAESNYVNYESSKIAYTTLKVGDIIRVEQKNTNEFLVYKVTSIEASSPVYRLAFVNTSQYNPTNVDHIMISRDAFIINFTQYNVINDNYMVYQDGHYDGIYPQTTDGHTFYGLSSGHGYIEAITNFNSPNTAIINTTTPELYTKLVGPVQLQILFGETFSDSKTPKELSKYEVPSKPKIKTPTTSPDWSPVKLPSTLPNKFPTEFPTLDPDDKVDPSRVTPYIPQPQPYPDNIPEIAPSPNPNPNPITIPIPSYEPVPQPTPSPDVDPSVEPTPLPEPSPEPDPTPTPEDTGSTPKPPVPVIPPISSSASGLLHVYNPTAEQVNEFGAWLWTTFSGDLIDTIAKLFNNPMDAVIGLHELYCTPTTGSSTTIKAGFLDSEVPSRLVTQRYTEINCGAITVPEYWGNYLDYAPYTKVYCYLPFIGIVELNTDDIIGHGVQIVYKIDTYNGSCIAMIITAKNKDEESTIYQFSGNCAVEVPITSGMKSAIQSALIGAATAAIGASAAGVVSKGMLTAAGVNGAAQHGLNGKNSVSHSGSFGSSYGAMGIKKPYIIVKRPVQKVVHGYNKKYGYPAHSMVNIGSCSGYLRCRDFEVVSSTATEEEKKRIEILLKEGVYV